MTFNFFIFISCFASESKLGVVKLEDTVNSNLLLQKHLLINKNQEKMSSIFPSIPCCYAAFDNS